MKSKHINPQIFKAVGHRLKTLREYHNISQKELSERAKCSQQFISDCEKGKCDLSLSLAIALSDVLGVDLNYFDIRKNARLEFAEANIKESPTLEKVGVATDFDQTSSISLPGATARGIRGGTKRVTESLINSRAFPSSGGESVENKGLGESQEDLEQKAKLLFEESLRRLPFMTGEEPKMCQYIQGNEKLLDSHYFVTKKRVEAPEQVIGPRILKALEIVDNHLTICPQCSQYQREVYKEWEEREKRIMYSLFLTS